MRIDPGATGSVAGVRLVSTGSRRPRSTGSNRRRAPEEARRVVSFLFRVGRMNRIQVEAGLETAWEEKKHESVPFTTPKSELGVMTRLEASSRCPAGAENKQVVFEVRIAGLLGPKGHRGL